MAARRPRVLRRPLRVYVDTAVFGGVHDAEFREPSERFFAGARRAFVLLVSEPLALEIAAAPEFVQATFEAHRTHAEALETTDEAAALAEAYLAAGVVPAPRASMPCTWPSPPWPAPMPSSAGTSSTWSSCAASAASTPPRRQRAPAATLSSRSAPPWR